MNADTAELATVEPWDRGAPRITAPRVFGATAGRPFFVPVTATGERPLSFAAEGLPRGLDIDAVSGVIAGSVADASDATVAVTATNVHGLDERELLLRFDGRLALTPPLGWNSWNCWGATVDDAKVRAAAGTLVRSGLAAHGFSYVNIDDGWQGEREGPLGALQANEQFPDMRALGEHVHALGLRLGIYSTPWVRSYAGYAGGSTGALARLAVPRDGAEEHYRERGWYLGERPQHGVDAAQWAAWGVDYLKYDWGPWELPDVEAMAQALEECPRDVVYSLSNSAPFEQAAEWARLAHCYRTTGDITDSWESVSAIGFAQDRWLAHSGPGGWADPDMLVVGMLGWGRAGDGGVRANRLTADEQTTHITLWALLPAPLLIGCDLTQLDDLTLRLLCNDEVLAVNQDPLGQPARSLRTAEGSAAPGDAAYARALDGGSVAVGLFNRAGEERTVAAAWRELGIDGSHAVRDLWARRDLGATEGELALRVPAHGARLVALKRR